MANTLKYAPTDQQSVAVAIRVVPHSSEHTDAVIAFNVRMREGGSKWGFYPDPEPDWIPHSEGASTWREYHLAVDDDGTVRGGYALKPQEWLIAGERHWVTDWQGPFTEAAIDVKYSPLMLKLMRGMLKDHPLLFSLGHGGTDEPIVDLLRKMGWTLWGVPFVFHINRPFRFLRLNRYLRGTPLRRVALDLLAFTGLGWLGIKALQGWHKLRHRAQGQRLETREVSEFGDWADALWASCEDAYACLAVRDRAMMNALMPATGWPGGIRLQMCNPEGQCLGWVIVHDKTFADDPRFGTLRVGLITDCFAHPDHAGAVAAAAHAYLRSRKVDMIFANLSHSAWTEALQSCGYTRLENRRIFALSPALHTQLSATNDIRDGLHLTNMDGHGPHGFY